MERNGQRDWDIHSSLILVVDQAGASSSLGYSKSKKE